MTTPVLITGFEYGVATLTANGGGLANTINGSGLSVQGTTKRSGNYALRTNITGTYSSINYTLATPTHVTGIVYIRFGSLPSGRASLVYSNVTAGASCSVCYNNSTQKFSLYNGSTQVDMTDVVTGVWYQVQFDWDCATGTTTLKAKIDGGAEYTHSVTQTATTFTNISVGIGTSVTGEVFHDDLVVSTTSGDYPVPPCAIVGLSPSSDGTHTNTANSIEFQDGTDIVAATTTAYTAVNSVPIGNNTTYIRQVLIGAYYAELKFTTDKTAILGAIALLAYRSSSTTADTGACYWIDEDAVQTTIWGNPTTRADYSETSYFYKRAILPVTAGGWDAAAIIAGKIRCGNSDDVTPNPYWIDLMIEMAYVTYRLYTSGETATLAGGQVTFKFNHILSASSGSATLVGNNATLRRPRYIYASGETATSVGGQVTFKRTYRMSSTGETVTLEGSQATLLFDHTLSASGETATLVGGQATLIYTPVIGARYLNASEGSIALDGSQATLTYTRKLLMLSSGGTISLAGNNATLLHKYIVIASGGSIALAGSSATFVWKHKVFASGETATLAGGNATLIRSHIPLLASSGSASLVGGQATLLHKDLMMTGGGAAALALCDATLIYTSSTKIMMAEMAQMLLIGYGAGIIYVGGSTSTGSPPKRKKTYIDEYQKQREQIEMNKIMALNQQIVEMEQRNRALAKTTDILQRQHEEFSKKQAEAEAERQNKLRELLTETPVVEKPKDPRIMAQRMLNLEKAHAATEAKKAREAEIAKQRLKNLAKARKARQKGR